MQSDFSCCYQSLHCIARFPLQITIQNANSTFPCTAAVHRDSIKSDTCPMLAYFCVLSPGPASQDTIASPFSNHLYAPKITPAQGFWDHGIAPFGPRKSVIVDPDIDQICSVSFHCGHTPQTAFPRLKNVIEPAINFLSWFGVSLDSTPLFVIVVRPYVRADGDT